MLTGSDVVLWQQCHWGLLVLGAFKAGERAWNNNTGEQTLLFAAGLWLTPGQCCFSSTRPPQCCPIFVKGATTGLLVFLVRQSAARRDPAQIHLLISQRLADRHYKPRPALNQLRGTLSPPPFSRASQWPASQDHSRWKLIFRLLCFIPPFSPKDSHPARF